MCQEEGTGERIHLSSSCGDDICSSKLYNSQGALIEDALDIGSGNPNQYVIKTKTANCKRATEDYFKSKVR